MSDGWGESAGVRVSLEDVDNFIIAKGLFKNCYDRTYNCTQIVFEDYGCEYYLRVQGEFAYIKLDYQRGNSARGADKLICSIECSSNYELLDVVKPVVIYKDYERSIAEYMQEHSKYVNVDFEKSASKFYKKVNLQAVCHEVPDDDFLKSLS